MQTGGSNLAKKWVYVKLAWARRYTNPKFYLNSNWKFRNDNKESCRKYSQSQQQGFWILCPHMIRQITSFLQKYVFNRCSVERSIQCWTRYCSLPCSSLIVESESIFWDRALFFSVHHIWFLSLTRILCSSNGLKPWTLTIRRLKSPCEGVFWKK